MPDQELWPKFLYKYRAVNKHSLQILLNNKIFFADPLKEFNDPFDCRITPFLEGTPKEIRGYFQSISKARGIDIDVDLGSHKKPLSKTTTKDFEKIYGPHPRIEMSQASLEEMLAIKTSQGLRSIGVFTLSEIKDDILMFSHYAKDHKGFVIEFDTNHFTGSLGALLKVKYKKNYPEINIRTATTDEKLSGLHTKSERWCYEKEWRIINHLKGNGIWRIHKDAITSIILGCKMPAEDIELLVGIAQERSIQVLFAREKKHQFGLDVVPMK